MSRRLKWNGWGWEDENLSEEEKKRVFKNLAVLGVTEKDFSPSLSLDDIQIPDPALSLDDFGNLKDKVSVSKYDRVLHSVGRSYRDLIKVRRGKIRPPDAVFYPETDEDIVELFELCYRKNWCVVPFGGGTNVVGCIETDEVEGNWNAVLVADLTRMRKILDVDEKSMTARVQCGIRGPDLENELRKFNLALRHYPQSFYFSTLGGWIATRSAGHFSSRYGKIENMIDSLKVITPQGKVEVFPFPQTAVGPDWKKLFTGSEGIFGIITEAVLRCHRIPKYKFSTSFEFSSFEVGAEALRTIVQNEIFPPLLRLLDEWEYMVSSMLSGDTAQGALLLVGFEADDDNVDVIRLEFEYAKKICERMGGKEKGKRKFEQWKDEYFKQPYIRDFLLDWSVLVDTLETATTWSNLMNLYRKTREAMLNAMEGQGFVLCRITHVYPSGASLYFSFFRKVEKGGEIETWWRIKKAASDAILENGGTISHHHGVGRDHKAWAHKELGSWIDFLKKIKKNFDPKGILNPGDLV